MTDIAQARSVLATWRELERPLNWTSTVPLIVGTAGNPDLLDAIDGILFNFQRVPARYIPADIRSIASAIIAADERMIA